MMLRMMLQSCSLHPQRGRRRRQSTSSAPPQPNPQQAPPAPVPGDEGGFWQGLMTSLPAVAISAFYQIVLSLVIIPAVRLLPVGSPAWEHLLRSMVIMSSFSVLYVGTYFFLGRGLRGFPLSVLVANHAMAVFVTIQRSWHTDERAWDMLLCSIIFMLDILIPH